MRRSLFIFAVIIACLTFCVCGDILPICGQTHTTILTAYPAASTTDVSSKDNNSQHLSGGALFVNVRSDLVSMGIYYRNAYGDGSTDDSEPFQAAIDYVAQHGGGTVYAPGWSVYMVGGLDVYDGVKLLGAGIDDTVFRAANAGKLITLSGTGPQLEGFTAYGTEDEAHSGNNWYADYPDSGGSGKASHVIQVKDTTNARIEKVRSLEGRYDSLYIRTVSGLSVIDCIFQRANRNIVSIVGDTEKFIFIDCYFGTLYGLYHFDIEANTDKYTREGVILNCQFDGSIAGTWPGTSGNWGYWLLLKGYDTPGERRDLNVLGCDFDKIGIRINKIFPNFQLTCNTIDPKGTVFYRSTSNNPVGDLKDSVIRGNDFVGITSPSDADLDSNGIVGWNDLNILCRQWLQQDCHLSADLSDDCYVNALDYALLTQPWMTKNWNYIKDSATFSGNSFFACNTPSWANDTSCTWPNCDCDDADFLATATKSDIYLLSYEDLTRMAENCPQQLIQAVRR